MCKLGKPTTGRVALGRAAFLAAAVTLGGCAPGVWNTSDTDLGGPDRKIRVPVTKASMPSSVQPYPRI